MGWIIVGLFVAGAAVCIWANVKSGGYSTSADDRMAKSFFTVVGVAMMGIAVLIALGAGISHLF